MNGDVCFECGDGGPLHEHHVVPESRGGTSTVALCGSCHAKAHGRPNADDWDISTLTSEAMRAKAINGEYTGGKPPYGKQLAGDGMRLEDNPEEQAILDEIHRLRAEGYTLADVADELNRRGVPRRNGNDWHAMAVSREIGASE